MTKVLKLLFFFNIFVLIVTSLSPVNLIGYLITGSLDSRPELFQKPFGISINHFVSYLGVSLFGFYIYAKSPNYKQLVYGLFFLSIILEFFHIIIPNRSFEVEDLISNIFGVIVAYLIIKIYLYLNRI
jgi:VanZ family protein